MSIPLPALSVVVPCFNEAENLRELIRRVTAACRDAVKDDYEIVIVNDGSRDESWSILATFVDADSHILAVNLSRNYGHQLALSAGLELCKGQRIFILDADLQDPPELLDAMMARMDEGNDVVFGQRVARLGEGWFKRTSASLFYRVLCRLVDIDIPMDTGDFRLMSRRALDLVNRMPERNRFLRGMVSWIGLKQVALLYKRQPRVAGETGYPLPAMLRFAMDALTSFSVRPLRLASWVGVTMGVAALCTLLYVFRAWIMGETVQGWTSLMVIVLVIGSAQLISLGIFGEYLGRLYMEVKQRPLYIIDEIRKQNKR